LPNHVKTTHEEWLEAWQFAREVQQFHLRKHAALGTKPNHKTGFGDKGESFETKAMSYGGEKAASIFTGCKWLRGAYRKGADDIEGYQVRTTDHPHGGLICRKPDDLIYPIYRKFICVIAFVPYDYWIIGWQYRIAAMLEKYWEPRLRYPAYLTHNLVPMEALCL
jgi:hypothetical protein